MAKFEVVSKYADSEINLIPVRATKNAAGYDFVAAVDTPIPSFVYMSKFMEIQGNHAVEAALEDVAEFTGVSGCRPTLVSTGVKVKLEDNQYLKLLSRSSSPLKYWLVCANGEGIIDADYYNNPDNEGEIFFQVINLSPFNIVVKAGEKICQGIICSYDKTEDDSCDIKRVGGFGSTDNE